MTALVVRPASYTNKMTTYRNIRVLRIKSRKLSYENEVHIFYIEPKLVWSLGAQVTPLNDVLDSSLWVWIFLYVWVS